MKIISRNKNEVGKLILKITIFTVFLTFLPIISAFNWTDSTSAYWKFDKNTGTSVIDSTGNNYNLTLNNSAKWITGKINYGVNASALTSSTNVTSSIIGGSALSFSGWINPSSSGYGAFRTISYKFHPTRDGSFSVYLNGSNALRFAVSNSSVTTYCFFPDLRANNNTWNHIVTTYNGSHLQGYLNNTLSTTTCRVVNTISVASSNVTFGYNNQSLEYFNGGMDEIGLWTRAINSSEVSELWNAGAGLAYGNAQVLIISPADALTSLNKTIYFIANHTTANTLVNTTLSVWYSNGTLFNSAFQTLTGTDNQTNLSLGNWQYDNYIWGHNTCDTTSCFSPTNRTFSINKTILISEGYNAVVSEGSVQTFNISIESDYAPTLAYLVWNGTNYVGSINSASAPNYTITRNLTMPSVSGTSAVDFNWSITLSDLTIYNSTTHTQTIGALALDNCSTFTTHLLNYTLKDELTQAEINGTLSNGTIEVSTSIYPVGSTTAITSYSQLFSKVSWASICVNSSLVGDTFTFSSTAKYSATDYQTEYNVLKYSTLTSADLNQNISLFDLPTTASTTFRITYKDTSFLPVSDAVIDISRQYLSEGVFKTVERPITDYDGKTTASLIKDTGIYNFYIYKNNILLATFLNVIPVCQNPAITDCTIDLNSFSSSVPVSNFTNDDDFLFTLANNRTSRITTLSFSIPSGSVSTIVLNVTKSDALGTNVCSTSTTTSAGTLSCTYSASIGNSTLMAKIYKDGVLVGSGQLSLDLTPSEIWGGMVVFLAIFLIVTLAGAGLSDNPVFTVIFFMIGVILLFALNLVAHNGFIGAGATILWLIMAIIIVITKGAKRQ